MYDITNFDGGTYSVLRNFATIVGVYHVLAWMYNCACMEAT